MQNETKEALHYGLDIWPQNSVINSIPIVLLRNYTTFETVDFSGTDYVILEVCNKCAPAVQQQLSHYIHFKII